MVECVLVLVLRWCWCLTAAVFFPPLFAPRTSPPVDDVMMSSLCYHDVIVFLFLANLPKSPFSRRSRLWCEISSDNGYSEVVGKIAKLLEFRQ